MKLRMFLTALYSGSGPATSGRVCALSPWTVTALIVTFARRLYAVAVMVVVPASFVAQFFVIARFSSALATVSDGRSTQDDLAAVERSRSDHPHDPTALPRKGMMRRHELTDVQWGKTKPLLPSNAMASGRQYTVGGYAGYWLPRFTEMLLRAETGLVHPSPTYRTGPSIVRLNSSVGRFQRDCPRRL